MGKLQLNRSFEDLPKELQYINAQIIPITSKDTEIYVGLPLHHRDPFDRILVAQAMNHSLVLISLDLAFDAYPIQRVWL
ncbi:MAG TPA: type II toxin-antitoxin system VapC family toxin [Kamptonema sp.]|nr:type II toxin-antitoxin system VapC family toxin [Kamptonema sp.]